MPLLNVTASSIHQRQNKKKLDDLYSSVTCLHRAEICTVHGTKKQAGNSIKEEATVLVHASLCKRTLAGRYDNKLATIQRIKRLEQLHEMESDGTFDLLLKEVGKALLEIESWKFLGGIRI